MNTRTYYRIQPAGLEISGHRSEDSEESGQPGVDVFLYAYQVCCPDVAPELYGDEVVVIEAPGHWSNGDVEGVRIDPRKAKIVRRIPLQECLELWERCGESQDEFERFF
jgi:hypothetical protein